MNEPDPRVETRKLVETLSDGDAPVDARKAAEERLRELASEWRGYPGQRRRGELPSGICVR